MSIFKGDNGGLYLAISVPRPLSMYKIISHFVFHFSSSPTTALYNSFHSANKPFLKRLQSEKVVNSFPNGPTYSLSSSPLYGLRHKLVTSLLHRMGVDWLPSFA